ncbi:MAG: dephospho-CoA kinase [Phycisphaerales bacterium]
MHTHNTPTHRPFILGLAGGIGAGKSSVARHLASQGALVIDSDANVRDLLTRPDIRDTLAQWWGPRVLSPDQSVNRSAVAAIVFNDPTQRKRLEDLLYPILHQARRETIANAAQQGTWLVVLDAPLLYEAGLDAECDAVLFVDSPRPLRLARVQASRGWDDPELARRESAQAPLEDKRRKAEYAMVNDGDDLALQARVSNVVERLKQHAQRLQSRP